MKVQCEYCDSYIEVDESYVCPNCGAPLGAAVHAAEEQAKREAEEAEAKARAEAEAAKAAAYAQAQAQRTQETFSKIVEGVVLGSIAAQQAKNQQHVVYVQHPKPVHVQQGGIFGTQPKPAHQVRPPQPQQGGIFGGQPKPPVHQVRPPQPQQSGIFGGQPKPAQPVRPQGKPVQTGAHPMQSTPFGFGKPGSSTANRPTGTPGSFGNGKKRRTGNDDNSNGPKGRR